MHPTIYLRYPVSHSTCETSLLNTYCIHVSRKELGFSVHCYPVQELYNSQLETPLWVSIINYCNKKYKSILEKYAYFLKEIYLLAGESSVSCRSINVGLFFQS
jgi:hypothetical protein